MSEYPNCDVKTAAKILCRCTKWVLEKMKSGHLRGWKLGGNKFIVDGKSLKEFLESMSFTSKNSTEPLGISVDRQSKVTGSIRKSYSTISFLPKVDKK